MGYAFFIVIISYGTALLLNFLFKRRTTIPKFPDWLSNLITPFITVGTFCIALSWYYRTYKNEPYKERLTVLKGNQSQVAHYDLVLNMFEATDTTDVVNRMTPRRHFIFTLHSLQLLTVFKILNSEEDTDGIFVKFDNNSKKFYNQNDSINNIFIGAAQRLSGVDTIRKIEASLWPEIERLQHSAQANAWKQTYKYERKAEEYETISLAFLIWGTILITLSNLLKFLLKK